MQITKKTFLKVANAYRDRAHLCCEISRKVPVKTKLTKQRKVEIEAKKDPITKKTMKRIERKAKKS